MEKDSSQGAHFKKFELYFLRGIVGAGLKINVLLLQNKFSILLLFYIAKIFTLVSFFFTNRKILILRKLRLKTKKHERGRKKIKGEKLRYKI